MMAVSGWEEIRSLSVLRVFRVLSLVSNRAVADCMLGGATLGKIICL